MDSPITSGYVASGALRYATRAIVKVEGKLSWQNAKRLPPAAYRRILPFTGCCWPIEPGFIASESGAKARENFPGPSATANPFLRICGTCYSVHSATALPVLASIVQFGFGQRQEAFPSSSRISMQFLNTTSVRDGSSADPRLIAAQPEIKNAAVRLANRTPAKPMGASFIMGYLNAWRNMYLTTSAMNGLTISESNQTNNLSL